MRSKAYLDNIMARAVYRILEDGTVFGEIPNGTGVWANEASMERCQAVLKKVLEEWIYLKRRHHEDVPFLTNGDSAHEDKEYE